MVHSGSLFLWISSTTEIFQILLSILLSDVDHFLDTDYFFYLKTCWLHGSNLKANEEKLLIVLI